MTLHINPERLMSVCASLMDGHVKYSYGSKARPLSVDAARIQQLDCSGFVQYVLFHSCKEVPGWPGGSWLQEEACRNRHLRAAPYSEASLRDDRLRIAFLPRRGARARHVWFTLNGTTLESHGGTGPNCRPWDSDVLLSSVSACYEIGPVSPAAFGADPELFLALQHTSYGEGTL